MQLTRSRSATDAVDYFQLIMVGGVAKISRLSRFFDTWNVTLAVTGGVEFPQFAAYSVPGAHKKAHVNNRHYHRLGARWCTCRPTIT